MVECLLSMQEVLGSISRFSSCPDSLSFFFFFPVYLGNSFLHKQCNIISTHVYISIIFKSFVCKAYLFL